MSLESYEDLLIHHKTDIFLFLVDWNSGYEGFSRRANINK